MPVLTATSPEARAYESLLKHSRACKLCRANGRDLCRTYLRLFKRWEVLNKPA
jgi:hypothetical protein